jgi:hypothetical protein
MIRATWPVPIALAALTCFGLVAALTGDGWRDFSSWIALAAPLAVLGWAVARRT